MAEKEIKPEVELIEVPTQTDLAFKKDEKIVSMPKAICEIWNLLLDINKKL